MEQPGAFSSMGGEILGEGGKFQRRGGQWNPHHYSVKVFKVKDKMVSFQFSYYSCPQFATRWFLSSIHTIHVLSLLQDGSFLVFILFMSLVCYKMVPIQYSYYSCNQFATNMVNISLGTKICSCSFKVYLDFENTLSGVFKNLVVLKYSHSGLQNT